MHLQPAKWGLRRYEARKITKVKNFDEINSELQKNGNLIQTKKAPRWKGFWGLRFFMPPFPNVYKAFGNSIDS